MDKYTRSYFCIYTGDRFIVILCHKHLFYIWAKMRKYLLSFFLILISFDSMNSLMPPLFRKFNVEIVNLLGFNKKLKVHCKSGSHDFPITYLNSGEKFQFQFTILLTTLYWCNLWQVRDVLTVLYIFLTYM